MWALYFVLGILVGAALTWFYINRLKSWIPKKG